MIARWRKVFDGDAESAGGRYDIYVMLAEAHNWTPEQIDRFDPDYITELLAQKRAKAEWQEAEAELTPDQRKAKERHRSIQRKLKILDRKGQARKNGRT